LAHIHKGQVLHEAPYIAYVGSPTITDFGEADAKHTYLVIDGDHTRRFVETTDRAFVTLDYDLTDEQPDVALYGSTLPRPVQEAIVRVRIACESSQRAGIDVARLRQRLYDHGAARVAHVSVTVRRSTADAGRLGDVTEQSDPLDALAHYLTAEGCDEATREEALSVVGEILGEAA
jgi:DNA repair exonuclease SbcCD nuclease subunit